EQVRALVRQLDVQTAIAANVHVIYLKNAEATRVAQTLRGILSGEAAPVATSVPAGSPQGAGGQGGFAQGGFAQGAGGPPPIAQGGGGGGGGPGSNSLPTLAPTAR